MLKENKGKFVSWLQQVLIECCYIKLSLKEEILEEKEATRPIMEPVPYHCISKFGDKLFLNCKFIRNFLLVSHSAVDSSRALQR